MGNLRDVLQRIFTLDLRSLALFRIGLGLMVVLDAAFRVVDAEIFYADSGLWPTQSFWTGLGSRPSLFLVHGSVAWVVFLFGCTIAVGLALMVGWRTRLMSVLAWLLIASAQNRYHYINTGADGVLILSLLYAVFLPLGACMSVDERRQRRREAVLATHQTVSLATTAWMLNLVVIYVFNVVNKWGDSWFDGTAVLRALHIDQHATPLGHLVRDHLSFLSEALTNGTLAMESTALLLLLPVAIGPVRTLIVVLMWMLHGGLAATMYLSLFSWVCMVAWLSVLPSSVWTVRPFAWLERKLRAAPGASTGIEDKTDDDAPHQTWRIGLTRGGALLAGVFVLAVAGAQIGINTARTTNTTAPSWMHRFANLSMSNHIWRMFAMNPTRNDGWFVIEGHLTSGRVVDLFGGTDKPPTDNKPRYVAHMYRTGRWRKFMMNNSAVGEKRTRERLAQYLCRSYNDDATDRLLRVNMWFFRETTKHSFKPSTPKKEDMGTFVCAKQVDRTPTSAPDFDDSNDGDND
jgi:hypothetical protein